MEGIGIILFIVAIFVLVGLGIVLSFFNVWLRAWLAGSYVSIPTLVAMRLRRVPYSLIVDAKITAAKAGIDLSIDELEAHYLAEGNLIQTVQALIAAAKAGIELNFRVLVPSIWLQKEPVRALLRPYIPRLI
jgi:uncharacterized protein YqfA (UPF0365 family)